MAQAQDAAQLRALYHDFWRGEMPGVRAAFTSEFQNFVIARHPVAGVVGFAEFSVDGAHAEFEVLYVHPDFRGRQEDIPAGSVGAGLMLATYRELGARGVTHVGSDIRVNNRAALGLRARLGLKGFGRADDGGMTRFLDPLAPTLALLEAAVLPRPLFRPAGTPPARAES